MGKRKRVPATGKSCCTRFPLPQLSNTELRYDGKRLHSAPGRRLRAKSTTPEGIIDSQMFAALHIANPHTIANLETIIKWAAAMWPELGWEASQLPYKVIMASSEQVVLLFSWPESATEIEVGDMHQQPPTTVNGWVEWSGRWRVAVPVPI